MVEFGMGVALVPYTLRQAGNERVCYRPLAHNALESQVLLLRRAGEVEPIVGRFADYLGEAARSFRFE